MRTPINEKALDLMTDDEKIIIRRYKELSDEKYTTGSNEFFTFFKELKAAGKYSIISKYDSLCKQIDMDTKIDARINNHLAPLAGIPALIRALQQQAGKQINKNLFKALNDANENYYIHHSGPTILGSTVKIHYRPANYGAGREMVYVDIDTVTGDKNRFNPALLISALENYTVRQQEKASAITAARGSMQDTIAQYNSLIAKLNELGKAIPDDLKAIYKYDFDCINCSANIRDNNFDY